MNLNGRLQCIITRISFDLSSTRFYCCQAPPTLCPTPPPHPRPLPSLSLYSRPPPLLTLTLSGTPKSSLWLVVSWSLKISQISADRRLFAWQNSCSTSVDRTDRTLIWKLWKFDIIAPRFRARALPEVRPFAMCCGVWGDRRGDLLVPFGSHPPFWSDLPMLAATECQVHYCPRCKLRVNIGTWHRRSGVNDKMLVLKVTCPQDCNMKYESKGSPVDHLTWGQRGGWWGGRGNAGEGHD